MATSRLLELINHKNYINGEWVGFSKEIKVINPAIFNEVGSVPNLSDDLIVKAIDNTVKAFESWSQTSLDERAEILRRWYSLIVEHSEELAFIITSEQGKPLSDAKSEILYGASFVNWFAGIVQNVQGKIKPGRAFNHKIITEYEPVGPVAAITPWNFPHAMIVRKVTSALAAGCSIILKPSELTPFSALALAKLATDAGIPRGVMNVITGDANNIGQIFCNDFRLRKLSFTGSTKVGKILYQNASNTTKRLSLELGGNAPFIIFDDMDLEKVASELIIGKIRNSGQSCTSPNRIFIKETIYEEFITILTKKFAKLKVGNGFDRETIIGPLINQNAIDKILKLIKDSIEKGGEIICGGNAKDNFLEPTIIKNCEDNMEIFKTEIFGPVLACYKFSTVEEVVLRSNDTEHGLQSYIYSKNIYIAQLVASKLDFGMVSVNDSLPSNSKGAFAGRKNSGFGVEGSDEGIFEYLNTKYINIKY